MTQLSMVRRGIDTQGVHGHGKFGWRIPGVNKAGTNMPPHFSPPWHRMNAVNHLLTQDASDVEIRIFRRGVSDQEVRQAIELVREYVSTQMHNNGSELDWWGAFAEVYDDLSRNFTPQQTVAFEIATATILVSFGCPSWSVARQGLLVAARTAGLDEHAA